MTVPDYSSRPKGATLARSPVKEISTATQSTARSRSSVTRLQLVREEDSSCAMVNESSEWKHLRHIR